jgi:hypothetical protein
MEYVEQNSLDIDQLDEDELLRILNELRLLDDIQGKL